MRIWSVRRRWRSECPADSLGCPNVAVKWPLRLFDQTLQFCRDTLGLPTQENEHGAPVTFGDMRLHLDRLTGQSQTDIWLEIKTIDTSAVCPHFLAQGGVCCDEVERLPEDIDGFGIAAPAGVIHLAARARVEKKLTMVNLAIEFVGIKNPNPFWLASTLPTDETTSSVAPSRPVEVVWSGRSCATTQIPRTSTACAKARSGARTGGYWD